MMPGRPAPQGASVPEIMDATVKLFRATVFKCLPLGLMAALFLELSDIYWQVKGHPGTEPAKAQLARMSDSNYRGLSVIGFAGCLLFFAAVFLRQRALVNIAVAPAGAPPPAALARPGQPHGTVAVLVAALRRYPSLLAVSLPVFMLLLLIIDSLLTIPPANAGAAAPLLLLLLIPLLALSALCQLLFPVVFLEERWPHKAILRTWHLVRPIWGKVFAVWFIGMFFLFCASIVMVNLAQALASSLSGAPQVALFYALGLLIDAMSMIFMVSWQQVLYADASSSA